MAQGSVDRRRTSPFLRPLMTQANQIVDFSDEFLRAVERLLPSPLSDSRRELLKRILHEWSRTDLPEHLSRERRAVTKKRIDRSRTVKKLARQLSAALSALDSEDQIGIVHMLEKQQHQVSQAELKRQEARLVQGWQFVAELAAITPEDFWRPIAGPHPRTIAAYLVLQDAAAIFEWLTGTKAARGVDRITGSETGPFFRFLSLLWPVVFGNGLAGLASAIRNWAEWRVEHRERSAIISNIALRHPTWGIFEHE
jgi:hypothetical protein